MKVSKLRIDGQFFYLGENEDIDCLKREIVDAVTLGARFINFTAIGHGEVSVLMVASLGARFEVLERTEQELADWEDNPPVIDYDTYGADAL